MSSRRLQVAIEDPTLELKIVSANDVSHIDAEDKLDVYAIVSIKGDATRKKQAAKTPIDFDGDSNPTWNHTVMFPVSEKAARDGLLTVCVKLFSYWLDGEDDLYMGEVNVSVQELLASNPIPPFANGNVNKMKSMTYPVKVIGETKPNAKLSLSYRFKPVPVNDLYPPPPAVDYSPPFDQPVYPNPDPARSGHPIIYPPQFQATGQTPTLTSLAMELVIKSANNIKNVNVLEDMDVYAWVMICEGKSKIKRKTKTPIAYSGSKSPTWNHAVKFSFSFDEDELPRENGLTLVVELISHRPLMGDKLIGEVKVRIQELIGSNPPSPFTDVANANSMKLATHKVTGPYGEKGTLSFTYRFLKKQVTIPIVPDTTPHPFIMYIPVPYPSANPVHGASGYMTVQPGANGGPNNGLVPIYMPPPYQPHGYQQYSQPQSQPQPQPQQQLPQLQLDSQSQLYQSHGYQQYSQPQQQLPQPQYSPSQPQPPQLPTQSPVQMQGAKPQKKPQGVSMAALGLGASVLGRVVGGALMSEVADEVNIYEVGACGL